MAKDTNSKMTTNLQLSKNEPKKKKLNKQLEQEQNQRKEDHMEGYQREAGGGRMGERVQGISINGRYKIYWGRLR